jgi:hypothetical protein
VVTRHLIAISGVVLGLTCGMLAQGGTIRRAPEPTAGERQVEPSSVNFSAPLSRSGSQAATKVVGTVIDLRQTPVAYATVQLRNLDNGSVVSVTESNSDGLYEFQVDEPGTFVVEMVLVDGYIIALSNAGSLARFETMQTVVQVPGRWDAASRRVVAVQNVANYFGVSAETSMTATTIGLAVAANIPPANPGVPVSP